MEARQLSLSIVAYWSEAGHIHKYCTSDIKHGRRTGCQQCTLSRSTKVASVLVPRGPPQTRCKPQSAERSPQSLTEPPPSRMSTAIRNDRQVRGDRGWAVPKMNEWISGQVNKGPLLYSYKILLWDGNTIKLISLSCTLHEVVGNCTYADVL